MAVRRAVHLLLIAVLVAAEPVGCSHAAPSAKSANGYERVSGGRSACQLALRPGPIPIAAVGTFLAGHPVADGFVVPTGTILVGGIIPDEPPTSGAPSGVDVTGWSAQFEVTGDPRSVIAAFIAQAKRVGLALAPSQDTTTGEPGSTYCRVGRAWYACAAAANGDGRSMDVEIHRLSAHLPADTVSEAEVDYQVGKQTTTWHVTGVVGASLGPPPPPVPSVWPALPTVGQRFAEGFGHIAPLTLVAGSRLLAPIIPSGCASIGWSALLAVDRDPTTVFRAYQRQVVAHTGDPKPVRSSTSRTGTRRLEVLTGAGVTYDVVLIQPRRGAPLLQIGTCDD